MGAMVAQLGDVFLILASRWQCLHSVCAQSASKALKSITRKTVSGFTLVKNNNTASLFKNMIFNNRKVISGSVLGSQVYADASLVFPLIVAETFAQHVDKLAAGKKTD